MPADTATDTVACSSISVGSSVSPCVPGGNRSCTPLLCSETLQVFLLTTQKLGMPTAFPPGVFTGVHGIKEDPAGDPGMIPARFFSWEGGAFLHGCDEKLSLLPLPQAQLTTLAQIQTLFQSESNP